MGLNIKQDKEFLKQSALLNTLILSPEFGREDHLQQMIKGLFDQYKFESQAATKASRKKEPKVFSILRDRFQLGATPYLERMIARTQKRLEAELKNPTPQPSSSIPTPQVSASPVVDIKTQLQASLDHFRNTLESEKKALLTLPGEFKAMLNNREKKARSEYSLEFDEAHQKVLFINVSRL
jgi:hypothetical protein